MLWQWSEFERLSRAQLYALLQLRQRVFVVEQDCAYLDADGRDVEAWHLMGCEDGRLVAYLRAFAPGLVYAEVAIGRVVTCRSARGRGVGRALMREGLHRVAQTWPGAPIRLSAQAYLEPFYVSLGFEVCGEGYLEDGAPHLPMRRGVGAEPPAR